MTVFLNSSKKQAETLKELETHLFFGLVFKGTLKDFEDVKGYLLHFTDAKLIFQHKDVSYLKVIRAKPGEEPQ